MSTMVITAVAVTVDKMVVQEVMAMKGPPMPQLRPVAKLPVDQVEP